jgi:hypothetical protein
MRDYWSAPITGPIAFHSQLQLSTISFNTTRFSI